MGSSVYCPVLNSFPDAGFVPIARPSSPSVRSMWFRLDDQGRCFEGHFDSLPILPGVAHLALALSALGTRAGSERVLTGVRGVQFRRHLHPGDEVEVVLSAAKESAAVRFEIRSEGKLATVGFLVFEPGGDVLDP